MRSAINFAVCKNRVNNCMTALCVKICNVTVHANSGSCEPLDSQAQLEIHSSLLANTHLCSTTACTSSILAKSGGRNCACLTLPHLLCYNSTLIPHIYLCSVRFQASAGNTRSGRSFSFSSSSSSSSSRPYGGGGAGGRSNNSNNNKNNNNNGRGINVPFKKNTNSTEDGELSKETVAAMRDDGIILEELFRNIPPNGAISLKSLSALISDTVKEALSERHNGLVSFIRERKHFFLLKERPEDKVFFVAANPLARQRYATREVQKRTMRDLMGLNSNENYGQTNGRNYNRGNDNGNNRTRGRGGSYGGSNYSNTYNTSGGGGGGERGRNNYSNNSNNNNNNYNNNNREDNRYGRGNNYNNNNYERGGERGNSYNDRRSGSQRGFGSSDNNNNERSYNYRERGGGGDRGNSRDGGSYQRHSFNSGGNRDRGRS